MYKLIAIDLDGTLLNSYGQISQRNKQTIKNVLQKGVEVVIASGRGKVSVENLANEICANHYIICGNGAMVYDLAEDKQLYNGFLSKKKILQLIQVCEENSIYYSIYTGNGIITKSLNYNVLFYHKENANKLDDKKTNIQIVQDIYNYVLEREEEDYLKVSICDESNIIFNSIIRKMKLIKNIDVLDVGHMSRKIIKNGTEEYSMEYFYTEITSQNVNKWTAINFLIQKLNIKPEEVMAIGDNVNDQIMLENAGLGVAMANSAPYIRNAAKEITDNNNEDGVAKAIEKFVIL